MSASTEIYPQKEPTSTCPPWCVVCWDLSADLPGSRFHHGRPSGPIPARIDLCGGGDHLTVQISLCQVDPSLNEDHDGDDTARVDLRVDEDHAVVSLSPTDARCLARELLAAADVIDAAPNADRSSA